MVQKDPFEFMEQLEVEGSKQAELRAPSENDLTQLSALSKKAIKITNEIVELEKQLAERSDALKKTLTREIPDLMTEVGMKEFTLDTGNKVAIKDELKVSIKQENMQEAHTWLRNNDGGDIIKNVVSASFGKEEDELAMKLFSELAERGLSADRKESVHWKTLQSWVKQRRADGLPVDEDLLGVFEYKIAKIS